MGSLPPLRFYHIGYIGRTVEKIKTFFNFY